jgi:hypothetical protein
LVKYIQRLNMQTAQPEREPDGSPRFIAADPDPALEFRICPDCHRVQPNTRNLCECQDSIIWSTDIDELLQPNKDLEEEIRSMNSSSAFARNAEVGSPTSTNSVPVLAREVEAGILHTAPQPQPDRRQPSQVFKIILFGICTAFITRFFLPLFNM